MAVMNGRSRPGRSGLTKLLLAAALLVALVFAVRSHLLLHASQAMYLERPEWGIHSRREGPREGSLPTGGGGSDGSSGSGEWRPQPKAGPPAEVEVWAGHRPAELTGQAAQVIQLLGEKDAAALEDLCGRCLLHQFKLIIGYDNAHKVCRVGWLLVGGCWMVDARWKWDCNQWMPA